MQDQIIFLPVNTYALAYIILLYYICTTDTFNKWHGSLEKATWSE